MKAVLYDPATGRITASVAGDRRAIVASGTASGRAWIEVAALRDDYDVTHRVEAGRLVPIAPEASEAEHG